jgi:hypothetical protein
MDHQPTRGSDKLKAHCASIATLTPAQISQVAGGMSSTLAPVWWIRGTPNPFGRFADAGGPASILANLGLR